MLEGLFGLGPPRVLVRPGQSMLQAVQAHRRQHPEVAGQREAGRTSNFIIYTDGTSSGDAAAEAMLRSCDADFQANQQWFGALTPANLPMHVYADPNAGGAYHMSCAGTDIHVISFPDLAPGFLMAEIVEVFEAAIKNGWDCGRTNGEALSRVLAFQQHPEIASDFTQTEQDWWSAGHADNVNDNSAGDTDQLANGCGDLFLYYLHSQLGFDWSAICRTGGKTLGACYQTLTGYDPQQGFSDFVNALTSIDKAGSLRLPASGDPFPLEQKASQ
jgi:hypothetical protein